MNTAARAGVLILGWIIAGGIGYWVGRSKQRHIDIWAPGPPVDDEVAKAYLSDSVHPEFRIPESFPEQIERHFKENVWGVLREQYPEMAKDCADFVKWQPEESVRLVPRYPSEPAGVIRSPIPGPPFHEPIADPATRELIWRMFQNLDVSPEAINDWEPPGVWLADENGELIGRQEDWNESPAVQAYWLKLLGDPTKKEQT